jgi:hypothetical protein
VSDEETTETPAEPEVPAEPAETPEAPADPLPENGSDVPTETPTPEPDVPADVPSTGPDVATAPVEVVPPPVAQVVEVPPEPVAPPPPADPGDGVAAVDAADAQAQADQAEKEAAARLALSTNTPTVLPPPLAGVADLPVPAKTPSQEVPNQLWVCVTEEGPRTVIKNVTCQAFLVPKIPPQGQLIACPTCGGTCVRQATQAEIDAEPKVAATA